MESSSDRKSKWSSNPCGNDWAKDENKYGQRLLEKMGWSKGKGLGKNEDGNTDHVKVKIKKDVKGLGSNGYDDVWLAHQEDFNKVLSSLNAEENAENNPKEIVNGSEELKKVKKRVHRYKKVIEARDLSTKSEKDLKCIFGTSNEVKDCSDADAIYRPNRGSSNDYFAKKLVEIERRKKGDETQVEETKEEKRARKKLEKERRKAEEANEEVIVERVVREIEEDPAEKSEKKMKKKKKRQETVEETTPVVVEKRKKKYKVEKDEETPPTIEKRKKKEKKCEVEVESGLNEEEISAVATKKKRRRKENELEEEKTTVFDDKMETGLNEDEMSTVTTKKKKRRKENEAVVGEETAVFDAKMEVETNENVAMETTQVQRKRKRVDAELEPGVVEPDNKRTKLMEEIGALINKTFDETEQMREENGKSFTGIWLNARNKRESLKVKIKELINGVCEQEPEKKPETGKNTENSDKNQELLTGKNTENSDKNQELLMGIAALIDQKIHLNDVRSPAEKSGNFPTNSTFRGSFPTRGIAHSNFRGRFPTRGIVHSTFRGSFPTRGFPTRGSVHSNFRGSFPTRGSVHQNFRGSFPTRGIVHSNFRGSFPTRGIVHSNFRGSFPTRGIVHSNFRGSFPTRGIVHSNFRASFPTRGSVHQNFRGSFATRGRGSFAAPAARTSRQDFVNSWARKPLHNAKKFKTFEEKYGGVEYTEHELDALKNKGIIAPIDESKDKTLMTPQPAESQFVGSRSLKQLEYLDKMVKSLQDIKHFQSCNFLSIDGYKA